MSHFLDAIPLGLVFGVSIAATFLSLQGEYRLGQRRRVGRTEEKGLRPGPFASAALSLLAFMLAVITGTVQSRLQDLKQVAQDEVNAIATVHREAGLLPPTHGDRARRLVADYLTVRLEALDDGATQPAAQTADRADELQGELWSVAVRAAEENPNDVTALFVESTDRLISSSATTKTLRVRYRLPPILWLVIYGLAMLALAMGGYDTGYVGGRRSVALGLSMAVAVSVVLMLLVGLDRTESRLLPVTRSAMSELQREIDW